jgi:Concanavalin A-like lectin/glucanases superfamily
VNKPSRSPKMAIAIAALVLGSAVLLSAQDTLVVGSRRALQDETAVASFSELFAVDKIGSPSGCVAPPNTTMVVWYPFDESSAGTARDRAMGNTGIGVGFLGAPPQPVPGIVGNALSFNGQDQFIQAPSTIVNDFGNAGSTDWCSAIKAGAYSGCDGSFSIEVWIKLPQNAPIFFMPIVDKDDPTISPAQGGYVFYVQQGRLGLRLQALNDKAYFFASAQETVYDDRWHHVAVTVQRNNSKGITWYYDGAYAGSSDSTSVNGSLSNNQPLLIGNWFDRWFFTGAIDELAIYNRVLTPKEISDIHAAGSAGKCKP